MGTASQTFKPVGGIASVAVVPAGTAAGGSPDGIAAAAAELPLAEGLSSYDETAEVRNGIVRVEHRLTVALPADRAREVLDERTLRLWASAGTAAVVVTESGERIVAGWSESLGSEQPLRLTGVVMSTDRDPHATPVAILTFRSVDTEPAVRMNN